MLAAVVTLSTAVAPTKVGVTEEGLKEALAPVGSPATDRETAGADPLTVTGNEADFPGATVWEEPALSEKLGLTVKPAVAADETPVPMPVTLIV